MIYEEYLSYHEYQKNICQQEHELMRIQQIHNLHKKISQQFKLW